MVCNCYFVNTILSSCLIVFWLAANLSGQEKDDRLAILNLAKGLEPNNFELKATGKLGLVAPQDPFNIYLRYLFPASSPVADALKTDAIAKRLDLSQEQQRRIEEIGGEIKLEQKHIANDRRTYSEDELAPFHEADFEIFQRLDNILNAKQRRELSEISTFSLLKKKGVVAWYSERRQLVASDRKDFEKWMEQFAEQQIKSRFQRCRNECLELLSGIEGLNDERFKSLKDPKLVTNSPLLFGCQLHAKIEKTSTDDLFEFLELCNSYFDVQVDGSIECTFSTTSSPSRELVVMVANRMHRGVEATQEQIADLNAALRPTPEQLENIQAKMANLRSRIGEVDASEFQTEFISITREAEKAAIKRIESVFVPVQMDYLNQVLLHRCIETIGPWQLIESVDCKQIPITRNIERDTAASLRKAQAHYSRFEAETFDEFIKGCNDKFLDVVRELDSACGQLWREPLPMRTWFLIGN